MIMTGTTKDTMFNQMEIRLPRTPPFWDCKPMRAKISPTIDSSMAMIYNNPNTSGTCPAVAMDTITLTTSMISAIPPMQSAMIVSLANDESVK